MWERLSSCEICISCNERNGCYDPQANNLENNIERVPNIRRVTVKLGMLHFLLAHFKITQWDDSQHLHQRRHWKYGLYSVRDSQKDQSTEQLYLLGKY